jgi:DNA-binding NtrC family response regulator
MFTHPRPSPLEVPRPVALLVVNPDTKVRQLVEKAIPEHRRAKMFLTLSDNFASAPATPPPDVVLINLKSETQCDFTQLSKVWLRWPGTQVIFLSPFEDIHLWAEAVQLGAYDFLPKSVDPDQLQWVLQGALLRRRVEANRTSSRAARNWGSI